MLARLHQAPQIIESELTRAMHEGTLSIEAAAKGNVPQDTRTLFRSIASKVEPLGAGGVRGLVGVLTGPAASYARVVEEGRAPGSRPPPTAPIAAWLKRKGRDPTLAYVVARAIGKRGIKARPYLRPAFEAGRGNVEAAFNRARDRIVSRLSGAA